MGPKETPHPLIPPHFPAPAERSHITRKIANRSPYPPIPDSEAARDAEISALRDFFPTSQAIHRIDDERQPYGSETEDFRGSGDLLEEIDPSQ